MIYINIPPTQPFVDELATGKQSILAFCRKSGNPSQQVDEESSKLFGIS
jgi:hypothetical protein